MSTLTKVLEHIGLGAKSSEGTESRVSTIWVYVPILVGLVAWQLALRGGAPWWLGLIVLIAVTTGVGILRVFVYYYLADKRGEGA